MHYSTDAELKAAMDADPTLAPRMLAATKEALDDVGWGNTFPAVRALAPAVCPLCQGGAGVPNARPCSLHVARRSAVDGWLPDLNPQALATT